MKNIVLFGGAFDPIHLGHLNMAIHASKVLDSDVFFIPANVSVWKSKSSPVQDKVNMIKAAIEGFDRFHISTFEIDRPEKTTYSIDTVTYFVNKYKDAKIYFIIGSDQVNKFHMWKCAREISQMVQLIYYPRPGYVIDQENIEEFNIQELETDETYDVASTNIRTFTSFDLPMPVIDYIIEHELYDIPHIKSFYRNEHRYKHSISVAKLAYHLAEVHNYKTPGRAFLAGLLHDIGKHYDKDNAVVVMKENFPGYLNMPSWSYHQFIGSYLAEIEFNIKDQDIINAIKFHASGRAHMSDLEKIVFASDKIDPLRGYDSSYMIKAMEEDIEKGFLLVYEENTKYLLSKGEAFDNPLTIEASMHYLKKPIKL